MGGMRRLVVAALVAASLAGCTNSDMARQEMKNKSEYECGVMRTVTAYALNGEQIGQWSGKIDVDYAYSGTCAANERVDIVVFDGSEVVDRIIISNAIVVVDND